MLHLDEERPPERRGGGTVSLGKRRGSLLRYRGLTRRQAGRIHVQRPWRGGRTLYSISAEGGEAKELYRGASKLSPHGAEWTKDGRNLLVASIGQLGGQLWAIAAEGGEPQPLNVVMRQILNPTVSPDGRQVAFTAVQSKSELWVIDNLLPDIEHRDKPTHSASK